MRPRWYLSSPFRIINHKQDSLTFSGYKLEDLLRNLQYNLLFLSFTF